MNKRLELMRLAEFAADLSFDTMPSNAIDTTKACLLYCLAVGIASLQAEVLAQVARAFDRQNGQVAHGARRFLDGSRTTAEDAAMINGVLMHIRMQEDAHPAGHPGVVLLPAALAASEVFSADGGTTLAAIAAGYEVALRIGRDHAKDLSSRGFRTTPIYGVIAAAVASGRVQHFDATRMAHAISLAANFAGGLREFQQAGTDEYAIQAGIAARNGLTAAALAAEGIAGAGSVLAGSAGFFMAFGDRRKNYLSHLTEGLGKYYEITNVTYKPYPGGQFHRGIIHGLGILREQSGERTARTIRVRMNPFVTESPGLRYAGPFSTYPQAFYSIPFCAALAWIDGSVTFTGLHRFDDPRLLALIPNVQIIGDLQIPVYGTHLEVDLVDGTTLEWSKMRGEDAYRLTWESAVRMATQFGQEVGIKDGLIEQLIGAVENLDQAQSVRSLIDIVCQATDHARRRAI